MIVSANPMRDLLFYYTAFRYSAIPHEAAGVLSNSCVDRFAACACGSLTQGLLVCRKTSGLAYTR